MRKVILYMTTTLDGFIAGPGNELDWMLNTPDPGLNDDIVALLDASDAGFLGYPVAQGMIPTGKALPPAPPHQRAAITSLSRSTACTASSSPASP